MNRELLESLSAHLAARSQRVCAAAKRPKDDANLTEASKHINRALAELRLALEVIECNSAEALQTLLD